MQGSDTRDPLAAMFSSDVTQASQDRAAERTRAALFGHVVPERRLSRYRLDRVLGAGAMGEVWLAHDPELSRDVAIKLVRETRHEHVERLAREARALAQLSHPNVVQVFDVGNYSLDDDGGVGVFVVMELVDGQNLAQWLAEQRRPWREIVSVFCDAAAGLMAAHQHQIIHRDFKPANVFVGRDARVRVGDFGLARSFSRGVSGARQLVLDQIGEELSETLEGGVTRTGAVMGTPLYMAPEQHLAATLDARSDQYAFCVALFEALYRQRPFVASGTGLLRAKQDEDIAVPEDAAAIPRSIHDAVLRGLCAAPDRRWPSMDHLREALLAGTRPARSRARRWALAITGGALVIGVVRMGTTTPEQCESLVIPWDAASRTRVREALGDAVTPTGAARVLDGLDRHARLLHAADDACITASTLGRSCLRGAATQLQATLELLEAGDPSVAEAAVRMIEALPDPRSCAASPSSVASPRGDALREILARARALHLGGRSQDTLRLVEPPLADPANLDASTRAVFAELQCVAADARDDLGDPEAARDWFRRCYYLAIESDDQDTAMTAALRVAILEAEARRTSESNTWTRHAAAARARVTLSDERAAAYASNLASVAAVVGDLEAASTQLAIAIEICESAACPATFLAALSNMVQLDLRLGKYTEAVELARRALHEGELRGGEYDVALLRLRLAEALMTDRQPRAALEQVGIVVPVLERVRGAQSLEIAVAAITSSQALALMGRGDEAVVDAERAWAIVQDRTDPSDPRRERYRGTLASARADAGDRIGAVREFTALLESDSDDLVMRASVLINRGVTYKELGDRSRAIDDFRTARALVLAPHPERIDLVMTTFGNEIETVQNQDGCVSASEVAREMVTTADAMGSIDDRITARTEAASLAVECGTPEAALAMLTQAERWATPASRNALWLALIRARAEGNAKATLPALRTQALALGDARLVGEIDDAIAAR